MIAIWALGLGCSEPSSSGNPPGGGPSDSMNQGADDTGEPAGGDGTGLQFDGEPPKNLLVISVDTLRRDYSGLYDSRGLTPHLTSLFSEGVVLENHHSCSNWTTPSFICAQTGRFPFDDGYWPTALSFGAADPRVDWPPPDLKTLASELTRSGYRTELVTTNSMFSLEQNGGAYGFQTETRAFDKSATLAVDLALEASDRLTGAEPWYLHVHFMDPHGPYGAPPEFLPDPSLDCSEWDLRTQTALTEFIWTRYPNSSPEDQVLMMACLLNDYGAEIRYFDSEFARLWSEFETKGLLEDTLVAFYTDHGEQFNEHGRFQHIWSLYAEENAASAAFWARNINPLRWSGPTIHQDIYATVLDALRVPAAEHSGVVVGQGQSDRALLTFNSFFDGFGETSIAAIQNDRKLMYWWAGGKRYFDISVDPHEQTDVYDTSDPQMMQLWEVLGDALDRAATHWPELTPIDPGP
jgi:arylsulfatase A-like enzyme